MMKLYSHLFVWLLLIACTFLPQTLKGQLSASDMRKRALRVGVMLPLHDVNGDGRRMVEYYRGFLMACDSLKMEGISIDVSAWNVAEDADISQVLKDKKAEKCDLIVGPLYSKQVPAMSDFVKKTGAKMLIPFSINAPAIQENPNIYQVYQSNDDFNDAVIQRYAKQFEGCHTVIIDCNDTTSKKGVFTFPLRKRLEELGRTYSITNIKSSESQFAKAFSTKMPNVVVLNTGRSPELNVVFAKLNNLTANNTSLNIRMFGYTEWMMYTKYNLDNFYRFNVYIPAAFNTDLLSSKTQRINQKYRWNFHADMMPSLPRFAITGFDHGYFFLKGLHLYGSEFTGALGTVGYTPIQTPLRFERVSPKGGWKNRSVLLIHYQPIHKTETLHY
ncbi:MAG: peptidoglycan-binding protein LysM [Prevotella sp.]|nr:peptidoglycan-binding protein LysM [Prevotella sp.]